MKEEWGGGKNEKKKVQRNRGRGWGQGMEQGLGGGDLSARPFPTVVVRGMRDRAEQAPPSPRPAPGNPECDGKGTRSQNTTQTTFPA